MRQSILQVSSLAMALKARGPVMVAALCRSRLGAYLLSLKGAVAVIEVLLVVGCAYQTSRLFWVIAAPSAVGANDAQTRPAAARPYRLPEVLTVTTTDLFRPSQRGHVLLAEAAPVTTLNLQLFGVRTGENSRSSAIIRRPDGTQDVFKPGQEIIDGVTLEEIAADRIVIRRLGVLESLFLDPSRTVAAPAAATRSAAASTGQFEPTVSDDAPRRRIPAEPSQLFAAIDIAPAKAKSGQAGLVMRPRGDGALFRDAGFEPGDVLLAVNGQAVSDVSRAAVTIQGLGNARSFTVAFERAGQTQTQRLVVDR